MRRQFDAWAYAVILFGVVLCLGAIPATERVVGVLLERLGGQPVDFTPPLRFSLGVLGAVTIGWGLTYLAAFRATGPDWRGLLTGVAAWYAVDSILSVVTGFGLNTVPNTVFFVWFLLLWRRRAA